MTHSISDLGIVGMGALGRALETFLAPAFFKVPPVVLFSVKAFDLQQAISEQADRWPEQTPFVVLCNGFVWPIVESLKSKLKSRPIRIGMTTIGSTIKPDGSIEIFSNNTVTAWGHWGINNTAPNESELQVLKLFPNGQWHDDIRHMIRQKWIFNVVINTLAGAYQLPKNGLLQNYHKDVDALFDEAIQLADHLWKGLPWDITRADLKAKLWALVQATSGNENSMARDIRLQRRAEIDFLVGVAVNYNGFPKMKMYYDQLRKR